VFAAWYGLPTQYIREFRIAWGKIKRSEEKILEVLYMLHKIPINVKFEKICKISP
jgi:hypothetical protein